MADATSAMLTAEATGVYVIAATPFDDAGDVDQPSIDSLVQFYLDCGVSGITILGVMGEFQKLSAAEAGRARPLRGGREGRVPIIVGVTNPGTDPLVRLANDAMAARRLRRHDPALAGPEEPTRRLKATWPASSAHSAPTYRSAFRTIRN